MLASLVSDLSAWWHTVPRDFAFLLALPFVVAVAGLISTFVRWRAGRR
jgi:hypothetical protein